MIIQIPNSANVALGAEWVQHDGVRVRHISQLEGTVEVTYRKPEFLCCEIRRPFSRYTGKSLVSALGLNNLQRDTITSGALSKSIAVLHTVPCGERIIDGVSLMLENRPCRLRIFGPLHIINTPEYISYLQELFQNADSVLQLEDNDFWWDLSNYSMVSFDRNFLSRVPNHVAVSFDKL